MLFKNVQNLVDIVLNLRGTFDFRRPWPIKARACPVVGGGWWCYWRSLFVVLSGAVSRTSRHDVSRYSTAAACSVLCPEVLTNYGLRPYRLWGKVNSWHCRIIIHRPNYMPVDLCCNNPHDFSHFIYEYINQPIKLTEPVKFYTKLQAVQRRVQDFSRGVGGRRCPNLTSKKYYMFI